MRPGGVARSDGRRGAVAGPHGVRTPPEGVYTPFEGVYAPPDGMYTPFEGVYVISILMLFLQAYELGRRNRRMRIKLATANIPSRVVYKTSGRVRIPSAYASSVRVLKAPVHMI